MNLAAHNNKSNIYQHNSTHGQAGISMTTWGFQEFFGEQSGLVTPDAYNTGWLARVPKLTDPTSPEWPQAINYLRNHQLDDGGWGDARIYYAHERAISTMSALLALLEWDPNPSQPAVVRGISALHKYAKEMTHERYEPIGFELLLPRLASDLEHYGLNLPFEQWSSVNQATAIKLELIGQLEPDWQNPRSWWFNMEILPEYQLVNLDERVLTVHGSIVTSPAATAAYLRALRKNGKDSIPATNFLEQVVCRSNGGAGVCCPIEGFELIWTLDSYMRAGLDPTATNMNELVQWLIDYWRTSVAGLSWSQAVRFGDGDITSVGYKVLNWLGVSITDDPLMRFWSEEAGYLLNYPDEYNASVSANVHALAAFRHDPTNEDHARIARSIADWLYQRMCAEGQLHDKWHFSPLYATTRVISPLLNWDDEFAKDCVEYVLVNQHDNGGWGGTGTTTLEETSYAVLALTAAHRAGYTGLDSSLQKATQYLRQNRKREPEACLWIGKTLYRPIGVTRALLASAHVALQMSGIAGSAFLSSLH